MECTLNGAPSQKLNHFVIALQFITIIWMLVECAVSLLSAKAAHSPALLAFGADSFVELFSATVVLLQFVPFVKLGRKKAARSAGFLLFGLAGIVATTAVGALVKRVQSHTSHAGMIITAAALLMMPTLAWAKRRAAQRMRDRALAADAVQSATCAYLAAIALTGLAINAAFRLPWVDSVAALLILPILVIEGRKALKGESCGCQ